MVSSPSRIQLPGLAASAFQHQLDKDATANLRKIKGFDKFMAKYLELGYERLLYFINIANNVRVGPRQFPTIYAMLQEACEILDVPEPELYISGQVEDNALTFGYNRPYIILGSALVDVMDDDELLAVIAHELGHIKCGHVLYNSMALTIKGLAEVAGDVTFGLGTLLGIPIQAGLLYWSRRAELSCDRAALLTTQDPRPCVTMLMKLAGGSSRFLEEMDPEAFLQQAEAYNPSDMGTGDKIYRFIAGLMEGTSTHPYAVERAKALNEWVDSAEFDQILAGNYDREPVLAAGQRFCAYCGHPIQEGHNFCGSCGQPIS